MRGPYFVGGAGQKTAALCPEPISSRGQKNSLLNEQVKKTIEENNESANSALTECMDTAAGTASLVEMEWRHRSAVKTQKRPPTARNRADNK